MGAAASAPDRSNTPNPSTVAARLSYGTSTLPDDIAYRDKKKKASKFATLRKKLIRVRRQSRTMDYSKTIRDLTNQWSIRELRTLVDDLEALGVLKELTICANIARAPLNSLRTDLASLFDNQCCTDIKLLYHGSCIPSHRAILSTRCPFFRDLLSRYPKYGAEVTVKVRTSGVDLATFTALIRYLYTDELNTTGTRLDNTKVLNKLIDEFGLPNPLENDMRALLDLGVYSDAVLVFSSCDDYYSIDDTHMTESTRHELRCHKAVLAARSIFFRNLLERRAKSLDSLNTGNSNNCVPCKIVLDENVIPKQYARVLLQAIYTDSVDLCCIVRNSVSMCSLSEVQAIVAGKGHVTRVDEAMDIYQIGQFLELPVLSQGCEDIISESINNDNLIAILDWSSEAHGSHWVHRQALHYLREEFLQISHSPLLYELSKDYLIAGIKSIFVQAPELDILNAVLKWGETRLMKRMEEREPNLLTHTAHSVAKKGIKKRDLNDVELRDILADILPYVCIDHVLPPNSDLLTSMIRRGLVSTPPSHMIGGESPANQMQAWVRDMSHGTYTQPRFFQPYYDELKLLLDERVAQSDDNDDIRVRMVRMSSIPDTLYMVDDHQYMHQSTSHLIPNSVATVDVIAGSIPVPDESTLHAMIKCQQTLQQSFIARRAYSLSHSDKRAITYQIGLRVVRQFGLPDSTVEVLHKKPHLFDDVHFDDRHFKPIKCTQKRVETSTTKPSVRNTAKSRGDAGGSEPVVREKMPDIAMATASLDQQLSLEQVAIHDNEFVLDLGDGGERQATLFL